MSEITSIAIAGSPPGDSDGFVRRAAREQARRLVPSATTVLGLLEHVTWMQRVWFEECVGGTSRRQLGLVSSPDADILREQVLAPAS